MKESLVTDRVTRPRIKEEKESSERKLVRKFSRKVVKFKSKDRPERVCQRIEIRPKSGVELCCQKSRAVVMAVKSRQLKSDGQLQVDGHYTAAGLKSRRQNIDKVKRSSRKLNSKLKEDGQLITKKLLVKNSEKIMRFRIVNLLKLHHGSPVKLVSKVTVGIAGCGQLWSARQLKPRQRGSQSCKVNNNMSRRLKKSPVPVRPRNNQPSVCRPFEKYKLMRQTELEDRGGNVELDSKFEKLTSEEERKRYFETKEKKREREEEIERAWKIEEELKEKNAAAKILELNIATEEPGKDDKKKEWGKLMVGGRKGGVGRKKRGWREMEGKKMARNIKPEKKKKIVVKESDLKKEQAEPDNIGPDDEKKNTAKNGERKEEEKTAVSSFEEKWIVRNILQMEVEKLDGEKIRKLMIGEPSGVDNTGHQMIAEMEEMIEKAWGKNFSSEWKEPGSLADLGLMGKSLPNLEAAASYENYNENGEVEIEKEKKPEKDEEYCSG